MANNPRCAAREGGGRGGERASGSSPRNRAGRRPRPTPVFADQVTRRGHRGRGCGRCLATGNPALQPAAATTQVRAIAEVATAATKGDLTRLDLVDARGEASDAININAMIGTCAPPTEKTSRTG